MKKEEYTESERDTKPISSITMSDNMSQTTFSEDKTPENDSPEIEFRSPSDEAWYGVEFWTMCDALVVRLNGFNCEYDEVYPPDDFKSLTEITEFEERFRVASLQMQDLDCPKVEEGTKVCATCPSGTSEVKFYDAIVVQVERREHGFDEEGSDVCDCNFSLYWKQGPFANKVTSAKVGDICLRREDTLMDPKVISFLKEAKRQLLGDSSTDQEETEWQQTLKKIKFAIRNYNLRSSLEGSELPHFNWV